MATAARVMGVGAFVLGGLVLFIVGLFMIGDRQMAFATKFVVYTEFTKSPLARSSDASVRWRPALSRT